MNALKNLYFKLYSNCKIVEGYNKAAIYDLQREKMYHIPKDMYQVIVQNEGQKISDIYKSFEKSNWEIIDEYFSFLIERDLILLLESASDFCDFPDINFSFEDPFTLNTAIIAFENSKNWKKTTFKIINNLKSVNCKNIQLRTNSTFDIDSFLELISIFTEIHFFTSLSLIVDSSILPLLMEKKIIRTPILNFIMYFGEKDIVSPELSEKVLKDYQVKIIYYENNDFPRFNNNEIRLSCFTPNIQTFSESQKNNIYYNKKVFIDINGDIYQSPYTHKIRGNIFESNLLSLVNTESFKEYWKITKDQIETCQDCEFRYACNDGRVPIKKSNHLFYIEEDCSYNPYKE